MVPGRTWKNMGIWWDIMGYDGEMFGSMDVNGVWIQEVPCQQILGGCCHSLVEKDWRVANRVMFGAHQSETHQKKGRWYGWYGNISQNRAPKHFRSPKSSRWTSQSALQHDDEREPFPAAPPPNGNHLPWSARCPTAPARGACKCPHFHRPKWGSLRCTGTRPGSPCGHDSQRKEPQVFHGFRFQNDHERNMSPTHQKASPKNVWSVWIILHPSPHRSPWSYLVQGSGPLRQCPGRCCRGVECIGAERGRRRRHIPWSARRTPSRPRRRCHPADPPAVQKKT